MRVIYLDVLLALNFGMDYTILRAAAAVSGRPYSGKRMCCAAGFGAVYAAVCVLVPVLSVGVLRVAVCAVMAWIAFAVRSVRQAVRMTLLVMLLSFAFGGCVAALEQLGGTMLTVDGVLYAPVSRRTLLAAAAISYGLSGIVFRNQAKEKRPYGETICLTMHGGMHELYLLVDSGNTLRDPMTGRSVIVLSRNAAQRILPEKLQFVPLLLGKDNAAELLPHIQENGGAGWRLISFDSIGGGGLMPCFRPDAVMREDGAAYDCMVAVSGAEQVCTGDYDGLIEP